MPLSISAAAIGASAYASVARPFSDTLFAALREQLII
jgi:hypothetical protein